MRAVGCCIRTVARHQAEASSDDGASLLERQRKERSGKIFTSRHDGMVVLHAQFDPVTGDLRMGRSRRTATDLQRAALALRDQGCIGCAVSPDYCRAHHIIERQHGGRTDYDNLVLVCNDCHHKIHDHGHTVEQVPCTSRYELRSPATPPTTGGSTAPRAPPA